MATTLKFLGSGSAFTVGGDNFQSNILLTAPSGRHLLLDCGTDIRFSLHAAGLSYPDITDIYISHLHSDHVGGLEYIGFTTKFDPQCERPTLYLSQDIANDLWCKCLAGGMEAIEGNLTDLSSYFRVNPLKPDGKFTWEGIPFQLVKLNHVDTGFKLMPAYGLFFQINGRYIFFSGDTKLCVERYLPYYQQADMIFHDCETSAYPTPVHAHYKDLALLPAAIKQKMWLYGYQPGRLPPAVKDGFLGFVRQGQVFEF